ncbi:MAG: Hsp20/alpha crystallin family protein [Steroidobacteraceae bacterium]|nr:Hsp20/alpha crystallin family protein [Steroidobacteraceae bacterium]
MATQQDITPRAGNGDSTQERRDRSSRASEAALRPPVDICETDQGITLCADMPGVSRDRLSLQVTGNMLMLEGTAQLELADQMQALHADVRSTTYRRTFALSNELETDKIDAHLKDGVLTVRIPKRAELRPRHIEVQAS